MTTNYDTQGDFSRGFAQAHLDHDTARYYDPIGAIEDPYGYRVGYQFGQSLLRLLEDAKATAAA